MLPLHTTSRRDFLRGSVLAGMVAAAAPWTAMRSIATEKSLSSSGCRVSLTTGEDRAQMAFEGLGRFREEISKAIGNKRVVIKPNNVAIDNRLCASAAENLEGILEFLKSIGKTNAVIAESAANGPTLEGFANYGYDKLAAKYGARMLDLDQEGFELVHCFDEADFRPHACRMSKVLLNPDSFIISAAKFKTHDRVVATLSLKNIVVGAPIKDPGFKWGPGAKAGAKNDKPIMHGSGFRGINYNLFALAPKLHPHLSVIDGYEGMEGEGPVGGTPVQHRVCIVSPDWLAADRLAIELMGIDFAKVGYLNYCAQARMGEADLSKMEILGPAFREHIKSYKLARNLEQQLVWMQPPKKG